MAMQTDVKVTKPLTATGVFKTQTDANCAFRTRIKGIYVQNGASAGTVVVRDGSSGGDILFTLNTAAAADTGDFYIPVPDQGILAENGLYGTLTNVAAITIFYG
jgi:hypothetical protein